MEEKEKTPTLGLCLLSIWWGWWKGGGRTRRGEAICSGVSLQRTGAAVQVYFSTICEVICTSLIFADSSETIEDREYPN